MRAAGDLMPQLPAARQGKTIGWTELPHQLALADNLVRVNAQGHGKAAGCLSESHRPQHWPMGKKPPVEDRRPKSVSDAFARETA